MTLHREGAREIAGRSRGTPRIANRLLQAAFATMRRSAPTGIVTAPVAAAALELFEVDDRGLDKLDRWVLTALCRDFGGGPVGLTTLAVAVGEETDTRRGRRGAVPDPAGTARAHPPGPGRHPRRVRPRRPDAVGAQGSCSGTG